MKSDKVESVKGDGLELRRSSNHGLLQIIGDGCRVNLARNSGRIEIRGDGCRLSVSRNCGDIEYTGDGGSVLLGPESCRANVKYRGSGGRVNGVHQKCPDDGSERGRKDEPKNGAQPATRTHARNVRRKKTRVVDSVVRCYVSGPSDERIVRVVNSGS